ncbi:YitT family protein [Globicatella sanguinis]|uniref:YitT family protein n=1 Tax=Globicatella sanguinis TaxID=13076 RepID=UPI002543656A|nr:YitT family protein [Globicatella sanguinis]MDK7631307.1 YitT family protein [Globicatella sanguinis]WIK66523.1 YitT family protein [Globicatella sanguinis]WKT55928.1 YitT family protein [Globicatella sanguinis]
MINKYLSEHPEANFFFQIFIAVISALIFGLSMKFFLIPGNIFSAGAPGLAQIINYFTRETALAAIFTTGNLYFILNIPLIILAYLKLGKEFTVMTLIVVLFSSLATNLFPLTYVSQNPLINAVIGGVLTGLGTGITIKYGMSSGGFDILSLYLSKTFGWDVGMMTLLVNSIIIIGSGLLYNLETAIFTLITIFVTSRMIDAIHTGEQRLTAFIVTNDAAAVTASIRTRLIRGSTIIEARGGYTGDKRDLIMVVINRYELHDLQLAVIESDSKAFVNIIQSTKVLGQFLTKEQQKLMKTQPIR